MTRLLLTVSVCGLGLSLCGCGGDALPSLGQVQGTVTLDGQPIEAAFVYFKAMGAAGSSASTNASGQYKLRFIGRHDGAVVGQHEVTVTVPADSAAESEEEQPARARATATYQRTVEPDENEFDFSLNQSR